MNIEEEIQKILIKIRTGKEVTVGDDTIIETLLTAYEKEKETSHYIQSQLDIANAKLIEEKEKNKNIDEFCRKELAFERRLKRENREPDEFNQGRFYVAENIRKIIEEEYNNVK